MFPLILMAVRNDCYYHLAALSSDMAASAAISSSSAARVDISCSILRLAAVMAWLVTTEEDSCSLESDSSCSTALRETR